MLTVPIKLIYIYIYTCVCVPIVENVLYDLPLFKTSLIPKWPINYEVLYIHIIRHVDGFRMFACMIYSNNLPMMNSSVFIHYTCYVVEGCEYDCNSNKRNIDTFNINKTNIARRRDVAIIHLSTKLGLLYWQRSIKLESNLGYVLLITSQQTNGVWLLVHALTLI